MIFSEEQIKNILPTISDVINDFSNSNIDSLMEKYNRNKDEK